MKLTLLITAILVGTMGYAQATKKTYCNPLVVGNIPKKALTIQAEYQTGFEVQTNNKFSISPTTNFNRLKNVLNTRLNYYKPIIAKQKLVVTLDAGYWLSKFNGTPPYSTPIISDLTGTSLHAASASTNIFKPINSKNFLLINAAVELNGNGVSIQKLGVKNLLVSGAILYGWKKGIQQMTAIGVLRAYRLGQVIYVPALLWNKNFNKKWGVEMLLPARGFVRYTIKKTDFITAGFDLEGTQYAYSSNTTPDLNHSFLRRGEIKPRIGVDVKLKKNTRFTANIGSRINARLEWADTYAGKTILVNNSVSTNVFVQAGFHIVSLKKKK